MPIEHKDIPEAQLHEPKGVSTALIDQVYVADGAGSGSWEIANPYGGIIYNDIAGSGTTITTPTTYSLVGPVTAATNLNGFTTNNLGRLTYVGTTTRHAHAVFDGSFKHSTGAGNDITFGVFKNGSLLGSFESIGTADSADFQRMVLHFNTMITTNDYFEIYTKTPTGNVVVFSTHLFLMGMPG
jgi:hypothetical protein